jgi:hypothetical protein
MQIKESDKFKTQICSLGAVALMTPLACQLCSIATLTDLHKINFLGLVISGLSSIIGFKFIQIIHDFIESKEREANNE